MQCVTAMCNCYKIVIVALTSMCNFNICNISQFFPLLKIHLFVREGHYVEPTIITGLAHDSDVVHRWPIVIQSSFFILPLYPPTLTFPARETFAPIVYLLKCSSFDEGISWNNEVSGRPEG